MNNEHTKTCLALLVELFPQADLQEAELAVFRDALAPFTEADVTDAIRNHRLKCRFNRPQFNEIISDLRLRGRVEKPKASSYKTVIAQSVARSTPALDGKPEEELILRYHRFEFFAYRKQLIGDDSSQRAPNEREIANLDLRRQSLQGSCARDLVAAGMPRDEAQRLAAWFNAAKPDFDGVIAGLHGIGAAA